MRAPVDEPQRAAVERSARDGPRVFARGGDRSARGCDELIAAVRAVLGAPARLAAVDAHQLEAGVGGPVGRLGSVQDGARERGERVGLGAEVDAVGADLVERALGGQPREVPRGSRGLDAQDLVGRRPPAAGHDQLEAHFFSSSVHGSSPGSRSSLLNWASTSQPWRARSVASL